MPAPSILSCGVTVEEDVGARLVESVRALGG